MKKPRILIIENDPQLSEALGKEISAIGFEPVIATTGTQGFKLALKSPADLLVVDSNLPDIDGLTILGQLFREGALEDRPVIVLSDYNEVDYLAAALSSGVTELWLKSRTNPVKIAERVKELLKLNNL